MWADYQDREEILDESIEEGTRLQNLLSLIEIRLSEKLRVARLRGLSKDYIEALEDVQDLIKVERVNSIQGNH